MILNGNKYIFINTDLWKLICDKDKIRESPIIYRVNKNDITFNLDNKFLTFKHNKNIIDNISYKDSFYKTDFENIRKIYESAVEYYNFENKILNDLKNKQYSNDNSFVILMSQNWIDNWERISNYENIKTKYLQKNITNKDDIMNGLIYYFEKNEIKYNELFSFINIRKFNKKEEIESYLKNESLVLINDRFSSCFDIKYSDKLIKYNAFNNKIHFYLDNNEILSFKSNNNVISLNGIINYSNLKQLIKIFYFQKKLKSNIQEKESKNKIYLISKKVINIYKKAYNYQKLYDFLMSNSNTQCIDYDSLDNYNYYNNIINKLLNDDFIEQFIQIEENKILTELKDIDENFTELEYKVNFPSEKNLKYIINFEIVDNNIKDFFIKNNFAKKEHFISLYSFKVEKRKILIIFEKDNKNYYEIGHFNDNEEIIIEYLIDELEKNNKYNIVNYFFNYGLNSFNKSDSKESQNIINLSTQYTTNKCFYYKIEENEKSEKKEGNQIPNDNNININNINIIDNKFVKEIFSILLSIFAFERNILKYSIQLNKSIILLLSNQFLIDLKNVFAYDKVYSILEKLNILIILLRKSLKSFLEMKKMKIF